MCIVDKEVGKSSRVPAASNRASKGQHTLSEVTMYSFLDAVPRSSRHTQRIGSKHLDLNAISLNKHSKHTMATSMRSSLGPLEETRSSCSTKQDSRNNVKMQRANPRKFGNFNRKKKKCFASSNAFLTEIKSREKRRFLTSSVWPCFPRQNPRKLHSRV